MRLADLAERRGEAGLVPQLALLFKSPIGVDEHRPAQQLDWLTAYALVYGDTVGKLKVVRKKGAQ